ncbi:hypothetical protein HAHI6034_10900 [Hathewaya histolytica]|uniref:DUF7210 domain-containing protein n=1 Tax=Hathewaya histolytica TaxID=1498 RepID=A0A4U9RC24_HATHI|nr:hypothetical protein [Hathewaya histolytica]VTQ88726.1 Uncharacterised protein [Hathewaya histolytica]
MAKKSIKVKALVNLKYDKECFTVGDELKVRVEDVKEMHEKGYAELLEETPEENQDSEGELSKEGE